MGKDLIYLLFAVAAGLCLSGIVANVYRLAARKPSSKGGTAVYCTVMVVAGASVLLENATRSFRTKSCSGAAYSVAVAIAGYWAMALGALLLVAYSKF